MFIKKSTDALEVGITRLSAALLYASRHIARSSDFVTSALVTAIFFLPMLVRNSANAGLLYTGDVSGLYWPTMMKTATLLSSFNFAAIDFSTYNGSADFFLSPNYFVLHPLIVIYSLLVFKTTTTHQDLGNLLALIISLHVFVACYFSFRLLKRYFHFEFWPAAFAATGFAFGFNLMTTLGQPMFVFCTTMLPVVAYAALRFTEAPSIPKLIVCAIPMVVVFLGGYVPLAVACLGLSLVIVAVKLILLPDDDAITAHTRVRSTLIALGPYVLASLVVIPYYLAIYQYLKQTISADTPSLFYSAHQLAQQPHSVLAFFSSRLTVPGPFYEFSFAGSGPALAIVLLFVSSPIVRAQLSAREWIFLEISFAIYLIMVLSTFGDFSAVSDMFFYYLPQIGGMHIYQRFLLLGHFFAAASLAIIVRAAVAARPKFAITALLALFGLALTVVSFVLAHRPSIASGYGLNQFVAFDLLLGTTLLLGFQFQSKLSVYALAVGLSLLPPLDRVYDLSKVANSRSEQAKVLPMSLDLNEQMRFSEFLTRFSEKKIIKYIDLTPLWGKDHREPFPKSIAYHYLKDQRLSSYHGFDFRMGPRKSYLDKMPMVVRDGTWVINPTWETISEADADFLVATEDDLKSGPLNWISSLVPPEERFQLPKGVVAVPLRAWNLARSRSKPNALDNGVFRISSAAAPPNTRVNLAQEKRIAQSSTFAGHEARHAVDGNITDGGAAGSAAANTFSHTDRDLNAWLDVDLGKVQKLDSVVVWNATKCCGFRLNNYWVFVSDSPFKATDTAEQLQKKSGVWGQMGFTPNPSVTFLLNGFEGRYVRIQFAGTRPLDEAYLHIAELQVFAQDPGAVEKTSEPERKPKTRIIDFKSNFANYHRIEWEADAPSFVQYLFSDNPRLSYYLNGSKIIPGETSGLPSINAALGRNVLEIKYRHPLLMLFWGFFFLFVTAVVLSLIAMMRGNTEQH